MDKPFKVAVIVGSLRAASSSLKTAKALIARSPRQLNCQLIPIGELPLYNEDLDGSPPLTWTSFRNAVGVCEAVLFITPEYNRSIPGASKTPLTLAQGRQDGAYGTAWPPASSASPHTSSGASEPTMRCAKPSAF